MISRTKMCALEASSQFIFERCVVANELRNDQLGRFAFELHNGYRHAGVSGVGGRGR